MTASAAAAVLALVGSVIVIGGNEIAVAAVSDDDCEVLLDSNNSIDSGNSGKSDLSNLADQADEYNAIADDISDKKLKKGLRQMADVYESASKAKNTTAAGLVIAQKSKQWAKGFKVYGKALNQCLASNVR
jgi:hypothetical protein